MSNAAKTAHSIAWTIFTGVGSRAIGLVGTLVLTRYLTPNEAGEVSAAHVIVVSLNQFLTFGVGIYLVANPKAGRDVAWHATVLHVGMGAIAGLLAVALRHRLAPTFDAPGLVMYVPGLALAMFIERVAFMPERVLVRSMNFRRLGLSRAMAEIAMPVVAVATARAGAGGYALVWGNLARSVTAFLMSAPAVERREWLEPGPLSWATMKMLIGYGTWQSLAAFAANATRRWDNLVVSRLYGAGIMGAYNLAYNLADVPSIQVGEQITDVLLSSLANMDQERRVAALVRASGLLALIMFPLAIGLGAVAPTVANTFLDPRWVLVGPLLMILSGMAIVRPLTGAILSYLQVRMRVRAVAMIEWATIVLILALLFTVGRVSPLWACVAVGLTFTARLFIGCEVVRRLEEVPVGAILARQWQPLLAAVPLAAAVLAVRHLFGPQPHGLHSAPMLACEVTAGAVAYALGALVLAPRHAKDFLDLALRLIRREHERD